MNKKKALSPKQVCEIYPTTTGTLANLRSQRRGPRYFKNGREILYRPADLEVWFFRHPVLTSDSLEVAHD